jgi:diguanylate cyclase (GGDEF)-like protein
VFLMMAAGGSPFTGENRMKQQHAVQTAEMRPEHALQSPVVALNPSQRALLMGSSLLDGVPLAVVQKWLTHAPVRSLARGEALITLVSAHETLFLLLSGELSVWLHADASSLAAGETDAALPAVLTHKEVARILPGESVGEQSLIDRQMPNAWAIAEQESQVLAVPADMVWESMHEEPKIALNLLRVLSARVRKANAGLSEAMLHQQRLAQDAETDALTGLPNRRWMDRTYRRTLRRQQSSACSASLLMIDIDHFKNVNDEHGHLVGDLVLCHAARCIEIALRPGDLCARYGGEEFCVLLPEVDAVTANRIAQRICATVFKTPFRLDTGDSLAMSVSVGVASWNQQSPLETLLEAADAALYQAKRQGRNRVVAALD